MSTPANNNEFKNEEFKSEFKSRVSYYLLPNHSKGTALLKFIRQYSIRYNIGYVNPYDILIDGFIRGLEYIDRNGKPIQKPAIWLRQTCLNILRDIVKENIQLEKIALKLVERTTIGSRVSVKEIAPDKLPLDTANLLEQIEALDKALEQLSPSDREIIRLRLYDCKTYDQIQKFYELKEDRFVKEATLRKRESRAVARLKAVFIRIYSGDSSSSDAVI